ncbi:MarR family transcriptional regulator [Aquicoccus sp. SCR17]|nr:MarR family transcriptional regulator [Carideicomes alvinocaridis]
MGEFLEAAGIERRVTDSALEVDAVLQQWRRRANKRELGTAALRAFGLGAEIDLAQLDVLIAIWAPSREFASCDADETMVSTIASRLGIDPSRASRLVSELISKGLARRAVSQQDARRTIVELTARGHAIVHAVRRFKFLVMGDFLSDWTQEELDTFVPLLERFVQWADEAQSVGPDRFASEIAEISAELARKSAS